MKGPKLWFFAFILLWLAGGCQQSVANQFAIAGAAPDYLLVVIVTLSLVVNRRAGGVIGFLGGVIQGAIAGGHMATYAITRTILGFLIGWLTGLEFEGNIAVAFVVTAGATCIAQVSFLLMSPRGAILPFLLATIGSAMYNGVLAMPLYALLKKVSDSPRR